MRLDIEEQEVVMRTTRAKAVARRETVNLALWATIAFFGLTPIALGVSLGIAQYFHLFH